MTIPAQVKGEIKPTAGWKKYVLGSVLATAALATVWGVKEHQDRQNQIERREGKVTDYNYDQIKKRVLANPENFKDVTIEYNAEGIATSLSGHTAYGTRFRVDNIPGRQDPYELFSSANIPVDNVTSGRYNMLIGFASVIAVLVLLNVWQQRRAEKLHKKSMEQLTGEGGVDAGRAGLGKSKAKALIQDDKKKTYFKDLLGIDEARDEIMEFVEILKNPERFAAVNGKPPKGIIMHGPPGTGKSSLARALATESGINFRHVSGADFAEMLVGVGTARIHDMFAEARALKPCILFIDEIEALLPARGGINESKEDHRTLDAFLAEMQGVSDENDGVFVIGATNLLEQLDKAAIRPGRFDRKVLVDVPDIKGRREILGVYGKKYPLRDDVDLELLARGTPGFSPAELLNVLNEAALKAGHANKKTISQEDVAYARSKVLWGTEKHSKIRTQAEKDILAWHEGGHVLVQHELEGPQSIMRASIVGRDRSMGHLEKILKEGLDGNNKQTMLNGLAVAMAGRVGEEMLHGPEHPNKITAGASGDIEQATSAALQMIARFGMSDQMGHVAYATETALKLLLSDSVKTRIQEEVQKLVNGGYKQAQEIMTRRRADLESLVRGFDKYETLEQEEIAALLSGNTLPERKVATVPAVA